MNLSGIAKVTVGIDGYSPLARLVNWLPAFYATKAELDFRDAGLNGDYALWSDPNPEIARRKNQSNCIASNLD